MKCPNCHVTLAPRDLEVGLASRACGQCGGQWIEGARYFRWLEKRKREPEAPVDAAAPVAPAPGPDTSVAARLCPTCGRLLFRATVGRGLTFQIDRCAGCGGIWFDAHEWEALRARGLHDDVHFVFSAAWQADVARQERDRQHESMLTAKLGPADHARVKQVRAWLDTHPRRAELYAVLLDGAEGVAGVRPRSMRTGLRV